MGFLKRILDSIPEEQKSGLETTMAHMVEGLASVAAAPALSSEVLSQVHSAGAGLGSQGVSAASEMASNAGMPVNVARGGPHVEV